MTRDNLPHRQPVSSRCASSISTFLNLLPVLAIFITIGFGSTVLVAAVDLAKEKNNRIKCARNLFQIGQAMRLYAYDNKCYPRTYYDPMRVASFDPDLTGGAANKPAPGPFNPAATNGSVGVNNVLAAIFLLVRNTDIRPDHFICPSSSQEPDSFTLGNTNLKLNDVSNFTSAANISYSFSNPYPTTASLMLGYKWSPNGWDQFVIAADRNDGFTQKDDAAKVTLLVRESPPLEQRQANSRNHDQAGQNVLCNDGSVGWATATWAGVDADGIYTAAKTQKSERGPLMQVYPAQSKDTITTDPQIGWDTILMPKF